jgi:RNA polymerase sigma factor (sigma-70 family)
MKELVFTEQIAEVFGRERGRLRRWIQRQVADPGEVEDILQDAFFELVQAYELLLPIEDAGAWLFRVARNRITDRFRRKRSEPLGEIEDLLPSPDAGPGAAYAREVLFDELEEALDELPPEQREAFVAHEVEGLSFKDLSARTGVAVNTLISRKHYAVLQLRRRLQALYDEFEME